MLQDMRVRLKNWVVADGEVPPLAVGDLTELGFGICVDSPVRRSSSGSDGIIPLESHLRWAARAFAEVRGRLVLVRDSDDQPVGVIVSVGDVVDLIVLGYPAIDQSLELIDEGLGSRHVLLQGDIVIEPYLWLPGVFRQTAPHGLTQVKVKRIHAIRSMNNDDGRGCALVDVPLVDPYDIRNADYLIDLKLRGSRLPVDMKIRDLWI